MGFDLSPDRRAGSLSIADQQKVEIMRALSRNASIVVMDEPTAALSGNETEALHEIIRSLVRDGKSVVLISHFLSEVLALADVITTLRDGKLIRTVDAKDATEETLIEGMLGHSLLYRVSREGPSRTRRRRSSWRSSISRHRASMTVPSCCTKARSLASPDSSARVAPNWPARYSETRRSPGERFV